MLSVLLPQSDASLDAIAKRSVQNALAVVASKASPDDVGVAIGLADRTAGTVRWGAFNGDKTQYPASTIKLFYLAYAHHRLATGKLKPSAELDRGLHDMIVDSVNDATALVLDAVTGTTGGPELSPKALKAWMDKRQAVNRWYSSLGYTGVNACQKTWNEGPYGRERQGYGPNYELRNAMSPLAGMRVLSEIMLDRIVSPAACAQMRTLLHRTGPEEGQVKGFVGGELPAGTEQWSKAGWTSTVRHDLCWFKAPDGREIVLAIFTQGTAKDDPVLPAVARQILTALKVAAR